MKDSFAESLSEIKAIIYSFLDDFIEEGFIRRTSINNLCELNDFVDSWAEIYCTDELQEED